MQNICIHINSHHKEISYSTSLKLTYLHRFITRSLMPVRLLIAFYRLFYIRRRLPIWCIWMKMLSFEYLAYRIHSLFLYFPIFTTFTPVRIARLFAAHNIVIYIHLFWRCAPHLQRSAAVTMWSGSLQSTTTAIRKQQNPNSLFDFCECMRVSMCVMCICGAHISPPSPHRMETTAKQPSRELCIWICVCRLPKLHLFLHISHTWNHIYMRGWVEWVDTQRGMISYNV